LPFDGTEVLVRLIFRTTQHTVQQVRAGFDGAERLAQLVHHIHEELFRWSI